MHIVRLLLLLSLLCSGAPAAEVWKRWPVTTDEFVTTIGHPPGFDSPRWRPSRHTRPKHEAPNLLSALFRSPDRKAEFIAVVYYVRHSPKVPEARRIALPIGQGEKLVHQKSKRHKVTGEQGPYWIYDEESTVEGPGYTSYRLNTFSTSSLPGAASVYWSFKVTDEAARKRYAPLWRKFKESLEIETD